MDTSGIEGSESVAAMNFYDITLKLKMAKSELKYVRADQEPVNREVEKRQVLVAAQCEVVIIILGDGTVIILCC